MPADASHETLTGTVERITFHNEENGFAILKVMVKGRSEPVTVRGNVATVQPGERLEAAGQWVSDPNYGRQFAAEAITTTTPSSLEGIRRYLGSGMIDGIGPKYAERLVEKFGERVFDVIEHQSGKLEDVEGIGKKRRIEIKSSWEKQKAVRQIMVFLHQHAVSTARAVRIYKRYGDTAIAQITANPFRLAEDVWGIGFKTADEIAARLGIEKAAVSRLRAGLQHVLLKATDDGHCALPAETLLEKGGLLLGEEGSPLSAEQLAPALAALLADATLLEETIGGVRLIFLPYLLTAEQRAAAELAIRLKDAEIENRPAVEVMRRFATNDTMIYADPPYLMETRTQKMYANEMSVDEHLEMLDVLSSHPGPVVISGYENSIYDKRLRRGWKTVKVKPPKVEKQAARMEVLWVKS